MNITPTTCTGKHYHIPMSHLTDEPNTFLLCCNGCDEVRAIYRARDIGAFRSTLEAETALLCTIIPNGRV